MTIWYGSDPHFYHEKIIQMCNRPFKTIEEMNENLLLELFTKIKKGDTVYLLGNIVFYHHKEILQRLRGDELNIHLIIGNHDNNKETIKPKYWRSVSFYKEIRVDDQRVVLSHYPFETWNAESHGSIHLHGHTHHNISHKVSEINNRMDVGYDNIHRFLISHEEVLELINKGNNE